MNKRSNPQPLHEQLKGSVEAWAYILGLTAMLITWALAAWTVVGNSTMTQAYYALPNPTPATQTNNRLNTPSDTLP